MHASDCGAGMRLQEGADPASRFSVHGDGSSPVIRGDRLNIFGRIATVRFEAIRRDQGLELFISATNVHTGELRVFTRAEVSAEAVIASAALPLLFRAVEIEDVPYWDGGYTANPPLVPFLRTTAAEDALIVQINPRERREVPTRTREIVSRVNEIGFNASLLSELRGVAFVNGLIDQGRLPRGTRPGEFRRLRLHRIGMQDLGESALSALDAFLRPLKNPPGALRVSRGRG